MISVGILSEPQGPAYLPPAGTGQRPAPSGHPDEWAGVSSTCFLSFLSQLRHTHKITNKFSS